jgi:hypothetical protein
MLTTKGVLLGQACRNVYYFYHAAMDDTILANTVETVGNAYRDSLAPQLCDVYALATLGVRRVDAAGYPELDRSVGAAIQGERTEDTLPSQTCVNVTLQASTTRPNRGRKYIGGFAEPGLGGDGRWTNTVLSAVQSAFFTLITAGETDPDNYARMVIARWNVGHTAVIAWNPVETVVLSAEPSALQSRKLGRGI